MKSKLLAFLLGIIAVCACAFGFAGCDLFSSGNNGGEHEHTLKRYEEKASTCTQEGRSEYWYCNSCGNYYADAECENKIKYSDTVIPKAGHTEAVDAAVKATCTKDGKTEGKHCSVCKEVLVAQEVVPAAHTETTLAAVPATCTTDGRTEGKQCVICTLITVQPQVIKAGHKVVTIPETPKTCTADGLTEGQFCSICKAVIKEQTVIEAGHTEVTLDAVAATCTAAGKTEGKRCSECNKIIVAQQIIEALGHSEEFLNAVPATCTSTGLTQGKYCTTCNKVTLPQTATQKADHTRVTDPAIEATCTSTGKTQGEHCSVCNTVLIEQQTVAKKPHGGNGKMCANCGELLVAASEGLQLTGITALPATYSLNSRSLDIIGFEVTGRGACTDADIIIPQTYDGLPVLGIAGQAFFQDTAIRTLTVPNGVKYIGEACFYLCTNLREVNIADSVTVIDLSAFAHCAFTSFICPEKLSEVPEKLFEFNTNLVWIYIPAGVASVGLPSLTGCTSLTDIYFGGTKEQWNSVKSSWADIDFTVNYYSATAPTEAGNYWRYVDGVPTKWN